MYKKIVEFYFTGTDTTKKVVDRIAKNLSKFLGIENIEEINFTDPKIRKSAAVFTKDELVIAGVPTIAGRVPNLLLPYLNKIEGGGSTAISVALYGNRNVDDCLMELTKILEEKKLKVIAAGEFIGEHSFSKILAANRPDEKDMKIVDEFSKKIAKKIEKEDFSTPEVPGEWPLRFYYTPRDRYGTKIDFVKIKPKTDMNKCIDCKICAKICPLGSINYENVEEIPGKCMKCCACIKKCPTEAKYFDDKGYIYHMHELEDMYAQIRREPKYYL